MEFTLDTTKASIPTLRQWMRVILHQRRQTEKNWKLYEQIKDALKEKRA